MANQFLQGTLHIPRQGRERALNEAAAMEYVATMTNIPIPKLHCSFEDDQAVYLIMEYVDGVGMDELNENQQGVVRQELEQHMTTLHNMRSNKIGGPSGLVRTRVIFFFAESRELIRGTRSSRPSE